MAETDLSILQELLDSEPVVLALGFPINAGAAAEAIRTLRRLAPGEDAEGIASAWNALCGAVGARLMAALLSGPEWHSLCPITRPLDDYDAGDHHQVVWLGDKHCVVGRAVFDGDTLLGVRFSVEPR